MSSLSHYIKKFSRLRRAKIAGEAAPHKPILLLAIMMGIETQEITENRIIISPELVARFKDLWHQLVHTSTFTSKFSLPFYMTAEMFDTMQLQKIYAFTTLRGHVMYNLFR